MLTYHCEKCNTFSAVSTCNVCGERTVPDSKLYWCDGCNIPLYDEVCSICHQKGRYFSTDVRPVFPQERLLLECAMGEPLKFHGRSV